MRENVYNLPLVTAYGVLGHLMPIECTRLFMILYEHSDNLPVSFV